MAVKAVFFDVGETLVDERYYWEEVAAAAGLPSHVVVAALGVTIARGEHHRALFGHLGIKPPAAVAEITYRHEDLHPDVLPCLLALRAAGYRLGVCGNQSAALEEWTRSEKLPVDVIGSSVSWGVEKPAVGFFVRIVEEAGFPAAEIAYVGDRVDNDVIPGAEMGLVTVHVRRGPWGHLQKGSERAAIRIDSLAELPEALERV